MNLKIACQVLIAVVGFVIWGLFAYIDPANRPDFLKFVMVMATGPILLALRDMQSAAPPPPPAPPAIPPAPTTVTKE